jgi:cyclic pyranopterin phosphate synthase
MTMRSHLQALLGRWLRNHQRLKSWAIEADLRLELLRHTAAQMLPVLIQPQPRNLTIAITAYCNLRCVGCRYGRDFMPNEQLPWPLMRDLLDDAKQAGITSVRLYGGEPLLHPDLPKMVAHACALGLRPYVTTNALLLDAKIDALYAAGLRDCTIGFYGVGDHYDAYVQRPERFARMEASIAAVRERYGMEVNLRLNWLLMRPSCSLAALEAAWSFAEKYAAPLQVDLIHYSLPYFSEGPDHCLQFRPEDRAAIERVAAELLRLKRLRPEMINHSELGLASIPDWLLKGPAMRVPCDKYQMIWVGADGTVQLCYVTFKLGNLRQQRLREMLFSPAHRQAARDAFAVRCPNCHCSYDARIQKHLPSRRHSAQQLVRLQSKGG